jgi:hypothetical protein
LCCRKAFLEGSGVGDAQGEGHAAIASLARIPLAPDCSYGEEIEDNIARCLELAQRLKARITSTREWGIWIDEFRYEEDNGRS